MRLNIRTNIVLMNLIALHGCAGLISQPVDNVPVEEPGKAEIVSVDKSVKPGERISDAEFIGLDTMQAELPKEAQPATQQSPVIVALLDDALQQQQQGRLPMAAATIERAIRLEPNNPFLWTRLAQVRLAEKNWQQAYVLANKSISLARSNRDLQQLNWSIIEQAKYGQGDQAAAEHPRQQIILLQSE